MEIINVIVGFLVLGDMMKVLKGKQTRLLVFLDLFNFFISFRAEVTFYSSKLSRSYFTANFQELKKNCKKIGFKWYEEFPLKFPGQSKSLDLFGQLVQFEFGRCFFR